jgi:metal-dependent amidase/aminoacylase/carboxypeptidase family protein
MLKLLFIFFLSFLLPLISSTGDEFDSRISKNMSEWIENDKALHVAPELSNHEEKTAGVLAKELRLLGFTVTEHVGKYDRADRTAYGVVGVFKNGEGPVVLVRITKGAAEAAGIPEELAPIITVIDAECTPPTYCDPVLSARLSTSLGKSVGKDSVVAFDPVMGAEDFGRYGLENRPIPVCFFWLGAADPAELEDCRKREVAHPSIHSSLFAPAPEASIRTGVKAMTCAVMELMK